MEQQPPYKLPHMCALQSPYTRSCESRASTGCNADTASSMDALFVCRLPGEPVIQLSELILPELRRSVAELTAFVRGTSTSEHQSSPATISSCKECVSTPRPAALPKAEPLHRKIMLALHQPCMN